MSATAYLSLGALLINGILFGYIALRGPRGTTARLFTALLFVFALWALPETLTRLDVGWTEAELLLLIRILQTALSFIPGILAHIALAYPRPHPLLDRPWGLLAIYTPSLIFAALVWGGDAIVGGVGQGLLGPANIPGSAYIPIASLYAAIIFFALGYLARNYLREEDRRAKRRYLFLLVGVGIGVIGATITEIYGPFIFGTEVRLGLGTLYTTAFAALATFAIFRYGFLVIAPAMEPASAGGGFAWERGRNYIVLERGRSNSFRAFRGLAEEVPGLCMTAFPPQLLSETYALQKTPILWLSTQEGYPLSLKPTYLEVDVLQTLLTFMRDNPGAALLLDDLEYLAQVNGFKAVLRALSRTAAAASKYRCTLLANLNPSSLDPVQVSSLRALFDQVELGEVGDRLPSQPLVPPNCVLWVGERKDCFAALAQAPGEGKTLVSTLFPGKLREGYDLRNASFLWLSPETHPDFPSYRPARLTLEVLRDLVRTMKPGSLSYIGELEVLIEEAGFLEVLEYTKLAVDAAIQRGGLVVASVEPAAVSAQVLSMLEKRFAGTAA
ncbi:MAG: DUF835 domain-containing protein [Thermoplasmata archaeon]